MPNKEIKTALEFALEAYVKPDDREATVQVLHALVSTVWKKLTLAPKDPKLKQADIVAQSEFSAALLQELEEQLGGTYSAVAAPKRQTVYVPQLPPTQQAKP